MKAVVAAFNHEKALVGAFSVIVQLVVEPVDRFTALSTKFSRSVLQSADNTVDGLSRLEEEGYTYTHYYGHGGHKTFSEDYK